MTVAELSPIELYSVVLTALVVFGLGLLGVREYPKLTTRGERTVFFAGMFALYGAPCVIALDVMGR